MNRDEGIDPRAQAVLDFWFGNCAARPEHTAEQSKIWFAANQLLDEQLRSEFGALVQQASCGELVSWESKARERLALIILVDQFRRNIYRSHANAFDKDGFALSLTLSGLASNLDRQLAAVERIFFLMPLQHAEALDAQQRSLVEFERVLSDAPPGTHEIFAQALKSAHEHHDLIARFGRFPHRNAILGRIDSRQEADYLAGHAQHFGQG